MARIVTVNASMHNTESMGGQQVRIPAGEYLLQLNRMVACSEKHWEDETKNAFMSARFTILDGPVKNRPYSELLTWADNAQFRFGRFLVSYGSGLPAENTAFDYPKFQAFAALITQKFGGKPIGAMIADNENNGRVNSQVVEFYPAADYNDRKGSNDVGATPAYSPAPTGNGVTTSSAPAADPMAAFTDSLEASLGNILPAAP